MFYREPMAHKESASAIAFPPLARALMDSLPEGILVFDADGKFLYANEPARRAIGGLVDSGIQSDPLLRSRLASLGARVTPLRNGTAWIGEVVLLPAGDGARTLAERERQAILDTLRVANGKLAETARRLGISRTTLWRRLRAYGLDRDRQSALPTAS